jgi:hypothetical protein
MAARLLLGRAFRLEGGCAKVDDVSGALDVFRRGAPEFPPFVGRPDLDESVWPYLNKNGIVLFVPGRLGSGTKRLKHGLGLT